MIFLPIVFIVRYDTKCFTRVLVLRFDYFPALLRTICFRSTAGNDVIGQAESRSVNVASEENEVAVHQTAGANVSDFAGLAVTEIKGMWKRMGPRMGC